MRCWFVSNKCMSISNLFMKVEMKNEIRVNGNRLWNALMAMAEIGPGVKGGSNRQSLTDVDSQGRRLFQSWREAEERLLAESFLQSYQKGDEWPANLKEDAKEVVYMERGGGY